MSIFGKKIEGPVSSGFPERESGADLSRKSGPETTGSIPAPSASPYIPADTPGPPLVQKAEPPSNLATSPNRTLIKESHEMNRSPYTIEDVIRLMRELPDSKKEMVVIIVQKTLLSAKIDIHSIIEDAGRKVDKLQRENDKMVGEIRELEEAIIQKKGEVDRLSRDIDETNGVKHVFEVVYGRHVKGDVENPLPEKTVPPAAPGIKIF